MRTDALVTEKYASEPKKLSWALTKCDSSETDFEAAIPGSIKRFYDFKDKSKTLFDFLATRYIKALFDQPDIVTLTENETVLRVIFLRLINTHQFSAAQLFFRLIQRITNRKNQDDFLPQLINKQNTYWNNLTRNFASSILFKTSTTEKRQEAISDAFTQIRMLLLDSESCVEVLKQLNNRIAALQKHLDPELDFSAFEPGNPIYLYASMCIPQATTKPHIKTHSLLLYVLFELLKQHNVKHDKFITFSGYVDPGIADNLIRSGYLFKEQYLMMNALTHGVYSHYIQWYLIAAAIDAKKIILQDDLTLRDLMVAMINTSSGEKEQSSWNRLLDYLIRNNHNIPINELQLGSPHALNSFLLFCKELPHLRGLLLNNWHHQIKKFQLFTSNKETGEVLSYERIAEGQATAFSSADLFNLGHTNKDIVRYYDEKYAGNSDEKVDTTNLDNYGVLAKQKSFSFWTAITQAETVKKEAALTF